MKWLAYDEGFDQLALDARRLAPGRWLVLAFTIVLVGLNLGAAVAAAWGGCVAVSEAAIWLATNRHARGEGLSPGRRNGYLLATLGGNLSWNALALIFWFSPIEAAPFLALLIWASLLLNAISHAFRSQFALLVMSGPTAAAMVAAPLLAPRYEGAQQAMALVGLAVCASYAVVSARRNVRAARELAAAQAEMARQTEAAQAASRAKSAFLAMMSHELRTPMNGVLGMAHALERTPLTPQQARYVQTLLRSGGGLMTILNDVLDLAKIEAGRFDIVAAPFDLRLKLSKVVDLWEPAAREKGLELVCEIAPDAPQWVSGDADRVRQVLLNLVSNAVKFTSRGEVRIEVRGAAGQIAITVADTGPGLDEATQARLFQGFTQADSSVARRFGGTGLGLAISRELARLMGGDISLESRLGEGSRFTLTLPLPPVEPPLDEPQITDLVDAPAAALRALVVDDNSTNQEVARALLQALEVTVETASSGTEALEVLERAAFDVVFMDIHMPGMSGDQALAEIRRSGEAYAGVRVVALTADAMAGERERLLDLGFDGYLPKPIEPAALVRALAS